MVSWTFRIAILVSLAAVSTGCMAGMRHAQGPAFTLEELLPIAGNRLESALMTATLEAEADLWARHGARAQGVSHYGYSFHALVSGVRQAIPRTRAADRSGFEQLRGQAEECLELISGFRQELHWQTPGLATALEEGFQATQALEELLHTIESDDYAGADRAYLALIERYESLRGALQQVARLSEENPHVLWAGGLAPHSAVDSAQAAR